MEMKRDFRKLLESMDVSDKQIYQGTWSRKHISASYFLRDAVRSSLVDSISASSRWLDNCKKAKLKCNSLAERAFFADSNYSLMLPGALLSTIILSATAIEAFLRHCFVSVLRTKSPRIGYETFLDKISSFNKKWPTDKIHDVISQVKADQLPDNVGDDIRDLFSFRNDVAHNDPIYHSSEFGKVFQVKPQRKDKKMVEKKLRQYKYYADLTSSNRPLLLQHAVVATITHDNLIEHITETAKDVDILHFLNEVDITNNDSGLIWNGLMPDIDYEKTKILSQEINSMNKELNRITIKERTVFLKSMMP